MKDVAINLDFLSRQYFYFDEPVPYKLKNDTIYIKPVLLKDSEIFRSSFDILSIDKNSIPDVKIIQMSYLQFLVHIIINSKELQQLYIQKLMNILILCLGFKRPNIIWDENNKPCLCDMESNIKINSKQFDDIKKIILYQNLPHYDDEYINPELKQAMDDVDELKNQDYEYPTTERRIAIITSHTGLPKREQELMTYRAHTLLFEEVCGEVEFTTIRPVALLGGSKNELDHWIFKKHKNKFDGYTKSIDSYTQSMGGAQAVKSSDTSLGDSYMQQINNFNK